MITIKLYLFIAKPTFSCSAAPGAFEYWFPTVKALEKYKTESGLTGETHYFTIPMITAKKAITIANNERKKKKRCQECGRG